MIDSSNKAEGRIVKNSFLAASEPYRQYLIGVQTLHNPYGLTGVHTSPGSEMSPETIANRATKIIWHGLRSTIHNLVNTGTEKNKTMLERSKEFDQHIEQMHAFISGYYENEEKWTESLNPELSIVRPAPFLERNLYKQLCEDRTDRLTALRLMGGLVVHEIIHPDLDNARDNNIIGLYIPRFKNKQLNQTQ